ncbi:MAG: carboxypeptidase regulatory-like domain-containing protein [Fibrobacter sp.]|nr:carboxypeptidase regulatory-like domain-containing protein [Fibrobacter sp.]
MKNLLVIGVSLAVSTAFAYTVSGKVTDESSMPIKGAQVTLVKENKTTTTDNKGEFTIHEDEETIGLKGAAVHNPGFISINSGILSYSQNGSSPVQVRIFDPLGNKVFSQTLYGSGQVDLSSGVKAKGTYFAQVSMGSAKETIRFNASGTYTNSFDSEGRALLKEVQQGEQLQFVAEGYDTLSVPLGTLDTTVEVKLTKTPPAEEQFAFGYALKNDPRPSKGCGKNSTLQSTGSVENGKKYNLNVGGKNRTFFITLPKNYDNTKPHKLLIANHCMGSKAEDFVHHNPDYDHPTPYYGQQVLDKNGDYIFVAPQGNDNGTWNGKEDHQFVDEMITAMFDNYCVDTTRVFATGFSFGAMFTNSLAQDLQERLRAVAVYATADYNIWLPSAGTGRYDAKNLPIAWMGVHGKRDGMCNYDRAKTSALPRILKRNGKADANGNFTDASSEKPQEFNGTAGHLCYDFTTVDPRFPVKWCSWNGEHQWTAHDGPNTSTGQGWQNTWVPEEVHKFFEQF